MRVHQTYALAHSQGASALGAAGTSLVAFMQADALEPEQWRDQLQGAVGVVSCLGGFGSNEFMLKVHTHPLCLVPMWWYQRKPWLLSQFLVLCCMLHMYAVMCAYTGVSPFIASLCKFA